MHPEERLTLNEALTAFTAQPAFTARRETMLGSITPGKLADLTVFSRNLFEAPPEEWPEIETEMTVVDGEIVYRREEEI
ncbi:MAG: amidohydrolase family protein [Thermodesulfobacteriota bacterium]